MSIQSEEYLHLKTQLDNYLARSIKSSKPQLADFVGAVNYSLLSGGKRLRGVMLLKTAQICGSSLEQAMPLAAAIEMIHAYSLIHDDLPAMDDDDFRRGKPSNHKVYGEAIAILAGDALLNYAYQLMIDASLASDNSRAVLAASKIIADAAGINGMLGGQVADISNNEAEFDAQLLEFIHNHKTAALLIAAVQSGAVLADCQPEKVEHFKQFAYHFGMAFQITDDILDVCGEAELLGKAIGSDVKQDKATYVKLYGLEKAKVMAEEEVNSAFEQLKAIDLDCEFLADLSIYLKTRKF